MPTLCPRCHELVESQTECLAGVRERWKCTDCGKLSVGFAAPMGRCLICGGEAEQVEAMRAGESQLAPLIREVMQRELDAYTFYRLASARTTDTGLRVVLDKLAQMELGHIDELETKYHLHQDPNVRTSNPERDERLARVLFEGLDFSAAESAAAVLDTAIAMEERTRIVFQDRATAEPEGMAKQMLRELAAEEEAHATYLRRERSRLFRS